MLQMSSQDDNTEITAETPMTQPTHQQGRQAQPAKKKKFFTKFTNKFPSVGSERKKAASTTKKSSASSGGNKAVYIDLDNRDPYSLNSHVKTGFEEVIGEPVGAHSDPAVWRHVNRSFHAGRDCCFKCLTYVCAIPLVFFWGCNFACITFAHIYSITPCFRVFAINCDCASKFFSTIVHCLCDPMYEAMALVFSKVYIYSTQSTSGFQEKTYAGMNMFAARNRINLVSVHSEEVQLHESIHEDDCGNIYVNTDDEHLAEDSGMEKREMYQHV